MTKTLSQVDISSRHAIRLVFEKSRVLAAIKKMSSKQDGEDLVTHPLRPLLLLEYRESLAASIAASVATGQWRAGPAYICLAPKRSGSYRELVFPQLLDSIVGRIAIDSMEPRITSDDNDRTFCGRSHVNLNREPGDYEKWFEVWQDYTSAIARAAQDGGYAYVYESDVTDFFPSIDRVKARQFLAQRTGASADLIELLFHCLESWLPRFEYSQGAGIPVENNDISRLVAHNYLKNVDREFVDSSEMTYLRFVDDTVVFVESEMAAEEVKENHHLALRGIGLNPNAAKTMITPIDAYQATRYREQNLELDGIRKTEDVERLRALVRNWYKKRKAPNWEQFTRRIYTVSRQLNDSTQRARALKDLAEKPALTDHVLKYLLTFRLKLDEVNELMAILRTGGNVQQRISISKALLNAQFDHDVSLDLANHCTAMIVNETTRGRVGSGYLQAVQLLIVNKHGNRQHRDRIAQWASVERLQDSQLRLHFLYLFLSKNELDESLTAQLRHLSNSDIELMIRLCKEARAGELRNHLKLLDRTKLKVGPHRTIDGRYLPFLEVALSAKNKAADNLKWIEKQLKTVTDQVVRRFLDAKRFDLVR